jgi:hypothetical protein
VKRASLIALCLALTLPAAPALAKKHKKAKPLGPVVTVTATGNNATGDGSISAATATCPAGKQAVGGGFTSPLADGNAVVVKDSFRSSPQAWTVRGVVVDGAGSVNAYAYCRRAKGHAVTDVTASAGFNSSGEVHTLAPPCTSGKLIGGGFESTSIPGDDAVVFPQENLATSPTTWTVTEVANQDGARTATAHAYCMVKTRTPTVLGQTTGATVGFLTSVASTTPQCPRPPKPKAGKKRKRKLLSAGGFRVSPVNGLTGGMPGLPLMVFADSQIGPTGGWFTRAVNGSGGVGTTVSVTSQGICF